MKNFLLILNIALLIAVGALYFIFFQYKSKDAHKIQQANAAVSNKFKIAYFELDSLQENYGYFKKVRSELNAQEAQMNKQLNRLRDNYLNKLKEYNQKGSTMSQTEQSAFEQQLMSLKNEYDQQQQESGQDMNNLYLQKMQDVKVKIQTYLKQYCRDSGYSYVFASSNEDYLYYKDTLRDITSGIVKVLNQQYEAEKKH